MSQIASTSIRHQSDANCWIDVWTSYQIRTFAGCACAGNVGNVFSPPPILKIITSQLSRHALRHVRDAPAVMHVGIANPQWRGKRSRHSRRMHNPQFYVFGKRPMVDGNPKIFFLGRSQWRQFRQNDDSAVSVRYPYKRNVSPLCVRWNYVFRSLGRSHVSVWDFIKLHPTRMKNIIVGMFFPFIHHVKKLIMETLKLNQRKLFYRIPLGSSFIKMKLYRCDFVTYEILNNCKVKINVYCFIDWHFHPSQRYQW